MTRVFEYCAGGMALKKIAALLNEERIPAPHDGGKGNKRAQGWGHTTILAMLRNEQYIGTWTWNRENWIQIAGTSRYRRIKETGSGARSKGDPDSTYRLARALEAGSGPAGRACGRQVAPAGDR